MKGSASFRITSELRILKTEIKKWTKEVGLKEEGNIDESLTELSSLDSIEGSVGLD